MSQAYHPLADRYEGTDERFRCLAALDAATLNPDLAAAFLATWGEGLRALVADFDGLSCQLDNQQYRKESGELL